MPIYEWKGFDGRGRKSSGVVDADSPRDARVKCKRQGNLVTDVVELRAGKKIKSVEDQPRRTKQEKRADAAEVAADKASVMGQLRQKLESARGRDRGEVRTKKRIEEISTFIRQLATLTRAGIPITESLRAIIEQQGGDPNVVDEPARLPTAPKQLTLRADRAEFHDGLA